jgi:stage II sporulation protein R
MKRYGSKGNECGMSAERKAGVGRTVFRAGAALLLGAALLAGLSLAGSPAPGALTPALAPQAGAGAVAPPAAAAPANLRRDGDTIGLGQIIRFRVIAASDSAFDQVVKLRVRDSVLDYLRPGLQKASSESAAAALITSRLPGIRQVASQTVRASGSNLPVQVYWGVTAFPDRAYGSVFYPAGNYQALKIVIGPGQGQNWWCVLFPPLCYVDLTRAAQDLSGGQQIAFGAAAARGGQSAGYPRLTTKIGAWLSGVDHHSLISLFCGK